MDMSDEVCTCERYHKKLGINLTPNNENRCCARCRTHYHRRCCLPRIDGRKWCYQHHLHCQRFTSDSIYHASKSAYPDHIYVMFDRLLGQTKRFFTDEADKFSSLDLVQIQKYRPPIQLIRVTRALIYYLLQRNIVKDVGTFLKLYLIFYMNFVWRHIIDFNCFMENCSDVGHKQAQYYSFIVWWTLREFLKKTNGSGNIELDGRVVRHLVGLLLDEADYIEIAHDGGQLNQNAVALWDELVASTDFDTQTLIQWLAL